MSKSKIEFTRADWEALQKAERLMTEYPAELDKAEDCGVDCTEHRAVQAELLRLCGKLKQHYFPTIPAR